MSSQFILIFGIICALIALSGGVWWWFSSRQALFSDNDIVTMQFPHGKIVAEVSAGLLKQAAGLSGRTELASSTGMLFVFSSPRKETFWMKGMKIPLDFIWLTKGVVIEIRSQVQPPKNILDMTLVAPSRPADSVLEVPAGTVQELKIQVGDKVEIKKNSNIK
ncbi:MAG: DUF192 domain-containing protein [Candidatus Paceibacterota bacterium]